MMRAIGDGWDWEGLMDALFFLFYALLRDGFLCYELKYDENPIH